jgi:hypothetical protein
MMQEPELDLVVFHSIFSLSPRRFLFITAFTQVGIFYYFGCDSFPSFIVKHPVAYCYVTFMSGQSSPHDCCMPL